MLSIHYSSHITNTKQENKKQEKILKNKIKPFINKYNWKGINFPSEQDDLEKIVGNILYAKYIYIFIYIYIYIYKRLCVRK